MKSATTRLALPLAALALIAAIDAAAKGPPAGDRPAPARWPSGSGYDFDKAAGTGGVTGGKYTYNVCRVMHKGVWHYGKLREDEAHCMFAGNATGMGVTTGFEVLVYKPT